MVSLQLTISLQKLYEFFNNHQNPDANRPKAYLNWILFDSLSR